MNDRDVLELSKLLYTVEKHGRKIKIEYKEKFYYMREVDRTGVTLFPVRGSCDMSGERGAFEYCPDYCIYVSEKKEVDEMLLWAKKATSAVSVRYIETKVVSEVHWSARIALIQDGEPLPLTTGFEYVSYRNGCFERVEIGAKSCEE